jgi:hypothetical protein
MLSYFLKQSGNYTMSSLNYVFVLLLLLLLLLFEFTFLNSINLLLCVRGCSLFLETCSGFLIIFKGLNIFLFCKISLNMNLV